MTVGFARDADGSLLVSGAYLGTLDMGIGAMTSAGGSDLFVAKIGANGSTSWNAHFGDAQPNGITRVAAAEQGGVYLAATFSNTVNFGGGPLASMGGFPFGDVAVAKLQANGFHTWSNSYGDSSVQVAHGVAVDSQDNVIVVGHYRGTLDFGQPPLVNASTFDEPYVAKLSGGGNYLWAKRFGAIDAFESTRAVAIAPDDSIVICGEFEDTINFGTRQLTATSTRDIFLAKLDEAGNHLWSQRFGTSGSQGCAGVAVDPEARIAITGHVDGAVDFGGGSLPASGLGDAFLAIYDGVGNHLWSKRFGDAEDQNGTSVTIDDAGNIVFSGTFAGEIDFGGGAVSSAGSKDAFIAKLSRNGVLLWSKRLGDSLEQSALFVACSSDYTIGVAGTLIGTVDLGGGSLVGMGSDVVAGVLAP